MRQLGQLRYLKELGTPVMLAHPQTLQAAGASCNQPPMMYFDVQDTSFALCTLLVHMCGEDSRHVHQQDSNLSDATMATADLARLLQPIPEHTDASSAPVGPWLPLTGPHHEGLQQPEAEEQCRPAHRC